MRCVCVCACVFYNWKSLLKVLAQQPHFQNINSTQHPKVTTVKNNTHLATPECVYYYLSHFIDADSIEC